MKKKHKSDFLSGLLIALGCCLGLLLVAGTVVAGYVGVVKYQSHKVQARWAEDITTTDEDVLKSTEAKERFHLITSERTANFYLNITTNHNESFLMGEFEMDYVVKKDLVRGDTWVDVIYKVPENWLIRSARDYNVTFEEKLRNPPIQKRARADPTFYRGKDYPDTIPFDEIEITTDYVYQYIDTNETEYDFIVRAYESSEDFNIKTLTLIAPAGYSITKG